MRYELAPGGKIVHLVGDDGVVVRSWYGEQSPAGTFMLRKDCELLDHLLQWG